MSIYLQHKEFFNKPIRLRPDINPFEVLRDWFNAVHLNEARDFIDQLTETALVCDNYHFDEPQRRDSILSFMRSLEECLEAAWLISQQAETQTPLPQIPLAESAFKEDINNSSLNHLDHEPLS